MQQEEKKIYFITDRTEHDHLIYNSSKVTITKNPCLLDEWLAKNSFCGLDSEYNGSRIFIDELILLQLGDEDTQFVMDCGSDLWEACKQIINKHAHKILFFGHSIKGDFNHLYCDGVYLERVYDTLIAEQRIYLGRTDIEFSLAALTDRYLKKYREKKYQVEFLNMTRKSKLHITHIVYAAQDVIDLIKIARLQRAILQSYNQYDWFFAVENPLVITLGEMELEGIKVYPDIWRGIIQKTKNDIRDQEKKLDAEVIKHYSINQPQLLTPNLFGEVTLVENHKQRINYNSPQQILEIVGRIEDSLPMFKEKGQAAKPSAREAAVQQFLIDKPNTPLRKFLEDYMLFKEFKKFLSSYGEKFLSYTIHKKGKEPELGYLNPVTNLCHTYFKQLETDTGRLASGHVDDGYYNCQNIPKKKEIREGFGLTEQEIRDGYFLTTCDLSGAEATIMAAFADEQYMYELAILKDDVHSPIATDCWRAVAEQRIKTGASLWVKDSQHNKYELTADFIISKEQNKGLRTDFKNFTFGAIYGMKDNKGATTLNISKPEARIMINVIKAKFPKIFKMVEEAEQCAFADGYVILNNRSNNRRWFTPVLDIHNQLNISDRNLRYHKTKDEMHFNDMMEISGAARNVRIQGTQADMVKEAMVVVKQKLVELTKTYNMGNVMWQYLPNRYGQQKLSVHDELVVKHKSKEFGTDIAEIMITTANKYLEPYSSNIRMKASHETLTHWTK